MSWYDNAVFYHIYPLGLAGAPERNDYGEPVHRLNTLLPWIGHIRELGCSALYIGPLFESGTHGYDTTDYRKLDSRLGTNEDLKNFVAECHRQGIRVILDGVFNHVGRDFFAFADLKQNRENSIYRDWFCNVNFSWNNEYNDGFSYENWGGYNLLVKLNQRNGYVQEYLCDIIRMWVSEFDIDGLRLDAADVLDFSFMQTLRRVADEVKPEFWLMGEVIHGDYTRWVNGSTLHSVTDYNLHKALYSGHNDHNYFEIAHTVKRLYDMGLNRPGGMKLYTFVDNHDVERIYTKLSDKAHFVPTHILLFTLPGIPSIYYGSEFAIEGRKEYGSDAPLRPALSLDDFKDALTDNPNTRLIASLARIHRSIPALMDGDYRELQLTTRQYTFARSKDGHSVIVSVNNDSNSIDMNVPAEDGVVYTGALSGQKVKAENHCLHFQLAGNSGEIWIPEGAGNPDAKPVLAEIQRSTVEMADALSAPAEDAPAEDAPAAGASGVPVDKGDAAAKCNAGEVVHTESAEATESKPESKTEKTVSAHGKAQSREETAAGEGSAAEQDTAAEKETAGNTQQPRRSYEEMTVEELQQAILEKLAKNGPVTDQMRKDVADNIWHNSLVTWVKSFC